MFASADVLGHDDAALDDALDDALDAYAGPRSRQRHAHHFPAPPSGAPFSFAAPGTPTFDFAAAGPASPTSILDASPPETSDRNVQVEAFELRVALEAAERAVVLARRLHAALESELSTAGLDEPEDPDNWRAKFDELAVELTAAEEDFPTRSTFSNGALWQAADEALAGLKQELERAQVTRGRLALCWESEAEDQKLQQQLTEMALD